MNYKTVHEKAVTPDLYDFQLKRPGIVVKWVTNYRFFYKYSNCEFDWIILIILQLIESDREYIYSGLRLLPDDRHRLNFSAESDFQKINLYSALLRETLRLNFYPYLIISALTPGGTFIDI